MIPLLPLLILGVPVRFDRTAYQIDVRTLQAGGSLSQAIEQTDQNISEITTLGAGAVILDGLPPISQWTDGIESDIRHLVSDLDAADIRTVLRQPVPKANDLAQIKKDGFSGVLADGPRPDDLKPKLTWMNWTPAGIWEGDSPHDFPELSDILSNPDSDIKAWESYFKSSSLQWSTTSPLQKSGCPPQLGSAYGANLNLIEQALTAQFVGRPGVDVIAGDESLLDASAVETYGPWEAPSKNLALQAFVQKLIQLRRQRQSLSQGDLQVVKTTDSHVTAIIRTYRFETTAALFNTDDESHQIIFLTAVFGSSAVSRLLQSGSLGTPGAALTLSIPAHGFMLLGNTAQF